MKGGDFIKDSNVANSANNIILFPRTLDYYQIQLTVMLENERYGEAAQLLQFLLQCQGQERKHYDEWVALLKWLEAAFPQYMNQVSGPIEPAADGDDDDMSEAEMASNYLRSRLEQDAEYGEKLLRMVMNEPLSEQTMFALEQLSYLEQPGINETLIHWLKEAKLHPLLQFRIVRTLRKRGYEGTITFNRGDMKAEIEVESVPLQPDEFPEPIIRILERVADQTEVHEPTLFYFAQELWIQFVMAVYGTDDYRSMLTDEDSLLDTWAAALHQAVAETLSDGAAEEEIRTMYGVTDTMRFRYEQAYRSVKQFVAAGISILQ